MLLSPDTSLLFLVASASPIISLNFGFEGSNFSSVLISSASEEITFETPPS